MNIWKELRYFKQTENWGDPERLDPEFLMMLDEVRHRYGLPFDINCGYEMKGHVKDSQHTKGKAADWFIHTKLAFFEQVLQLLTILEDMGISGQVGLGIYPDWKNPGFHLDNRGYRARWGRIGMQYVSFEEALDYARKNENES